MSTIFAYSLIQVIEWAYILYYSYQLFKFGSTGFVLVKINNYIYINYKIFLEAAKNINNLLDTFYNKKASMEQG